MKAVNYLNFDYFVLQKCPVGQTFRQVERWTGRKIDRWMDRQTDTDGQVEK